MKEHTEIILLDPQCSFQKMRANLPAWPQSWLQEPELTAERQEGGSETAPGFQQPQGLCLLQVAWPENVSSCLVPATSFADEKP